MARENQVADGIQYANQLTLKGLSWIIWVSPMYTRSFKCGRRRQKFRVREKYEDATLLDLKMREKGHKSSNASDF